MLALRSRPIPSALSLLWLACALACGVPSAEEASARPGSPAQALIAGGGERATSALTVGNAHVCALARNGQVFCGGANAYGQLGDGTTTDRKIPARAGALGGQLGVSGQGYTSCSWGADGSAHCWGLGGNGQLGNNGSANSTSPVSVLDGDNANTPLVFVTQIAAGLYHACALNAGGYVSCWGYNGYGELGDGTTVSRAVAKTVANLSQVVAIAVGNFHSCALLSDHTVRCWGYNGTGQLGNNSTAQSLLPSATPIALSGPALQISAGAATSCALIADGTEQCWGDNSYGQLGNPNIATSSLVPVNVLNTFAYANQTNIASISSGGALTNCAALANGIGLCWGYNQEGQAGVGQSGNSLSTPLPIHALGSSMPVLLATGQHQGCALAADGTLWCFGANSNGQLGTNNLVASTTPVQNLLPASTAPAQQRLSAGEDASCVIAGPAGRLYCWGSNVNGAIGDGTHTDRAAPVSTGLTNIVSVAMGNSFGHALRSDGTVWVWGTDHYGENGSVGSSTTPAQLQGLANVIAISPVCAIEAGGQAYCWGYDNDGEVGNGTKTLRVYAPVPVTGMNNAVAIASAQTHSCAIRADGTVWCWGSNMFGAIGDGSFAGDQTVPVQALGISGAVSITASVFNSCATTASGSAYCWGYNDGLNLGVSSDPQYLLDVPYKLPGVYEATAISLGGFADEGATCLLNAVGQLYCWGSNNSGEVGNGTLHAVSAPSLINIPAPSPLQQISTGAGTTAALRADGSLWSWGKVQGGAGYVFVPTKMAFTP